jgi:hypothetical protein
MTTLATRPGPNGRARPSLGDQLDRLDGILNGLADAPNQSVTAAVSAAVGNAVREAVEAATRELVARSASQASVFSNAGVAVVGRTRRSLRSRARTVVRRLVASVGRETGRLFRRFGDRVVALVHRTMLAPGRLAALVLAGVIAGAVAGVCGPLAGAALGGLAAFAAVLVATAGG